MGGVGRRKGVLCKGLEVGGGATQSWRNWKLFHPDWGEDWAGAGAKQLRSGHGTRFLAPRRVPSR